jgi:hypothetical protein
MLKSFSILFLLFPFLLCAQGNQNAFVLKPSLGINACQIHGDSYSGYDKAGLFLGIAVNTKIKEKLFGELGFYFSQKGARRNEIPKNNDYRSYNVTLNYLELPISAYYKVNQLYSLMAGPSVAYLISSTEYINKLNMSEFSKFNKFEIGLNIGLTRKIKNIWFVELRCSNSITPIRNYGIAATGIFYPNPVARFFNKGLYNNILTMFVTYVIDTKKISGSKKT